MIRRSRHSLGTQRANGSRRALLAAVAGGLAAFAGCSDDREEPSSRTTADGASASSNATRTDSPADGVEFEVENNDDVRRVVSVRVEVGGVVRLERSFSMRPDGEREFANFVGVPTEGTRRVRVRAELRSGASETASFEIRATDDPQNLYVTVGRDGGLRLSQGSAPPEPDGTTTA